MLEITTPECTLEQSCTPFSLVQVTLTKQEFIDLKWQVNHYRDLWKRTRVREQELLATIALMKKREDRLLTHRSINNTTWSAETAFLTDAP
ncbi:hypothetical protein [Endozoicomonas sp. ALC013]|uniref:hypothetical protein n=1 Tax=Endozoicomonas sp. ALC013 TaxID=3403076 RepID=UPI003BB4D42A